MPSILFVCTGNQFRSPVAAAYFKKILNRQGNDHGWNVDSAGSWTIDQQPPVIEATSAALRLGLDIHDRYTKLIDEYLLLDQDLILVMERGHKEAICIEFPAVRERVFLMTEMVDGFPGDIPDPLSSPGQAYRLLKEMCDLIEKGFPRIKQLAEALAAERA